jgi:hypothetical protein
MFESTLKKANLKSIVSEKYDKDMIWYINLTRPISRAISPLYTEFDLLAALEVPKMDVTREIAPW